MRRHVVVIGAGVGGLAAAIHARLRGHEVLVLEGGAKTGGKAAGVDQMGYRFDPGPSIIILTRVYERLFADAGRKIQDYLTFRRLDPITRVFFGSEPPFDIPANREACEDTVRWIAPKDGDCFADLLRKLDEVAPLMERTVFRHPIDRRWQLADPSLVRAALRFDPRATYRELVDRWFQSPVMRAFFYGFPSYSGQTYGSRSFAGLLIPYFMVQDGVFYPEGGVAAIPAALERLARELGAEFRLNARVVGMDVNGDRAAAVRLDTGERVEAGAFVSNVDRLTTRTWLGIREPARPSFSYFTCQWGLRKKLSGLAHHTLLVPHGFEKGFEDLYERRRFPDPPIVYLNETTGVDPSAAPPGSTNLFAVVSTPAVERGLNWADDVPVFREAVLRRLRETGFEWSPDEVEVEMVQTPRTFESAHGNRRGSLYGPDEAYRLFGGLFPLRNWDEQFRNLFYCGGSVQPGAGLPMVTLSGQFAVEAMERRRG